MLFLTVSTFCENLLAFSGKWILLHYCHVYRYIILRETLKFIASSVEYDNIIIKKQLA